MTYVGPSSDIDAGAIKVDNPTGAAVPCISVRVQIGGVTFEMGPKSGTVLTEVVPTCQPS